MLAVGLADDGDDDAAAGVRARAQAVTPAATTAFDSDEVPEAFDVECHSGLV